MRNVSHSWMPLGIAGSSINDVVRWRGRCQSDRDAFIYLADGENEQARLTYGELDVRARAIGADLQSRFTSGDRAVLMFPPGLDFICAFWGCLYAGLIAVPIYPPRGRSQMPRLDAVLRDSSAAVIVSTSKMISSMARDGRLDEISAVSVCASDEVPLSLADSWQHRESSSETTAILQYTSGSTGQPKGVVVALGNVLYNASYICKSFELNETSRSVCWLPHFHDMGLVEGLIAPVYGGFAAVLMPPIAFVQRPVRWLKAFSQYRGTHGGAPNFAFELCLEKVTDDEKATLDLTAIDSLYNGAETIRQATMERFVRAFGPCGLRETSLFSSYGLAEATVMVSGSRKPLCLSVDAAALSLGRAVPVGPDDPGAASVVSCGGSRLQTGLVIVDPNTGKTVDAGMVGELWVSGPTVCDGYWRRPEESDETFRLNGGSTEERMVRTGDLGFEHDGEVYVTGRLKDVIIVAGRNIYPQDVEWAAQHADASLHGAISAAFAVDTGSVEQVVLVQEVPRTSQRRLDGAGVIRAILRAVAETLDVQIDSVLLLKPGTIPKTSSGKAQRGLCRRLYLGQELAICDEWHRRPLTDG